MCEEKKENLKKYQKNYREANKSQKLIKKCITISITNFYFADLFSYLSMHCLSSLIWLQRCFDSI